MLEIILVVTILFLIAYIVARMVGVSTRTFFSIAPSFLAIVTIVIFYNNYRNAQTEMTIVNSTSKLVNIFSQMVEHPDLVCLLEDEQCEGTDRQKAMVLKMLKVAENVNIANDLDGTIDDDNAMWLRILSRWLARPSIYNIWQEYSYMFQDSTNRLFSSLVQ